MSMGTYEDHTADSGDLGVPRDAARGGRAAAMARRRALAAGRTALAPAHERAHTGFREDELRAPEAAGSATPAASNDQGAPSGAHEVAGQAPVAIDGVAAGRLGRALSMQRRRQLSQGKQALGGDRSPAASAATPVLVVHRGGAR